MTTDSANLLLIDTSVWIEYFRKKRPAFDQVEGIIEEGRVCTARLIVAEILQGARSRAEFDDLRVAAEVFHLLDERPNTWIEAARLSGRLRQKGQTIGLADCYLATLAFQHKVSLWSFDKHFWLIQKHLKVRLFQPGTA